VGFEAMPQIADLEITATWDEIELEAALRGGGAEAPSAPSAEVPSSLAEALRAVESLKQLPREERRRRAEELLRTLTTTPATASPEPEPLLQFPEPASTGAAPSVEPTVVGAEVTPPIAGESANIEPAAVALDVPEPSLAPPSADPTTLAVEAVAPEAPPAAEASVTSSAEISEPPAMAPPSAEPEPVDVAVNAAESSEPSTQPARETTAPTELASAVDAPATPDPAPEVVAVTPVVEAVLAAAPALPASPMPARALDAIPRFLATECTALESEQPDSLIPLRAVAATGALIGAVMLIYLGSSQEFGVAARPILGAGEVSETHSASPRISASLAARQALVAPPPDFGGGPQSVRPHRPALVGFDLFDDPAPTAVIAVKPDASPAPAQATPVVPQSSAEQTAALPPPTGSDTAALIKRGDELLKAGDIAAARSAYERAAAGGDAKALIGVGKTYDPLVLAKLGARGVRGDPVQAASWYARAGDAGDEEGQQRLHALISGLSDCMLSQGTCASRKP
jgi:hypothetical protein